MNEFSFEELYIGQTAEFSVTIESEMPDMFRKLSGDTNPLHCDRDYAVSMGYSDRVIYGMLTASFYSTLAGVYLPGKYCLLYEVNTSFNKPVFIGDTLKVRGEIKELDDKFRFALIKAVITNQNGEKVSKATIKAGVKSEIKPKTD